MTTNLHLSTIPELIQHLRVVLNTIPQANEAMRHECKQIIKRLVELEKGNNDFPTDKKVAREEIGQFLKGSDKNIGAYERFCVTPEQITESTSKPSKKRSGK